MSNSIVPAREDREQALRRVLESQAFARSEQLKNFLRYVCELEIAGRGGEIKEYSIGVEALGRPTSYSPTADSSVRRRAFELRQKLEEAYAGELAATEIVIDLPKGSYVPVFRYRAPAVIAGLVSDAAAAASPPRRALAAVPWAAGIGFLVGALAMRLLWSTSPAANAAAAILHEAWGPLATPEGNILICVASNFHLLVRPGGFSPDSDLPSFPAPPEIEGLYRKTNPLRDGSALTMRPAPNVATLGVVGGIAAVSSTLHALGAQSQILPERSAPLASFRNRNVILFGDPITSFAAAQLLSRARLTVAQDPATNRLVIRDRQKPASDPPAFSRHEGRPGDPAQVYGLLTVLPSDGTPGQPRRTLIVSGVSQVGIQGAAEFFTSPELLADLKNRLRQDGLSTFPKAYQLVVRCTAQDSLPLSCSYASHYVLEK